MSLKLAIGGKGGVGKTTITALLARCLAADKANKVIAIDADPVSNLAAGLGIDAHEQRLRIEVQRELGRLALDRDPTPNGAGDGVDRDVEQKLEQRREIVHGLGLGEPITRRLRADHWRHVGDAELAGCRLDVELAIEFWPLLGDSAEHTGGSRLVDASTRRLQLTLRSSTEKNMDFAW